MISTPEAPSIVMAAHVARIGGSPKRSYSPRSCPSDPLGEILLSCARESQRWGQSRRASSASILQALASVFNSHNGRVVREPLLVGLIRKIYSQNTCFRRLRRLRGQKRTDSSGHAVLFWHLHHSAGPRSSVGARSSRGPLHKPSECNSSGELQAGRILRYLGRQRRGLPGRARFFDTSICATR